MKVRTLFAFAIICLATTVVFAQSPAGKWTGEMQGGRGAQPVTLDLTVNGTALTGTLTLGQGQPIQITDGKIEGNKITFKAAGGGGGRGGGGRGGAGAGAGAGAPDGGAPPAGGPPAGAGAGGGGQGGGGGRGGAGAVFTYTGTITGSEMSVTRAADAPAGAPAAGGAPAGGGPGGGGAAQPQTFTLKKS